MAGASQLSLDELARQIGAEVRGDRTRRVRGVAGLKEAGPEEVAFFANPRYRADLKATRAAAVILSEDEAALAPEGAARLVAPQPYVAFAKASALFHPQERPPAGAHPSAQVAAGAEVDPTASIGAGCIVGRGARIGPRTVLHAGSAVLDEARVGADCVLWTGAVVRERCILGDRVLLQPNAVVGSDGFGFAFDLEGDGSGPIHRKVPQAGIARIEDDVELGACTCVDRATLGETVVGRGTKVDNLVQIAHNVRIGPLSLIVAQVGISGSTDIGAGVVLAGQVGIVGHVKIGDGARIGAQAGVPNDVPEGATYTGYPAMPHREWLRTMAALPRVPELIKLVRKLEARLAELERSRGK
ncbi:MAG TPA: UDP-3-O-(3-hydroxymyristoyl)glucosamine N-acyltransferase [Myxococcales bacterium]|nr:UDP-3-O-(3-hydroxymyristoyl)glucosamine N-acyltransferase [Myxococcales bacterium]